MAAPTFDRVLWLQAGTYYTPLPPEFLRVVNGGYASYYGNENAMNSGPDQDNQSNHDGGSVLMDDRGVPVFLRTWQKISSCGAWSWNSDRAVFERVMDIMSGNGLSFIRIGDKYGWGSLNGIGVQDSDLYYNYLTSSYSTTIDSNNWASFGNSMLYTAGGASSGYWSYPFTGLPSAFGSIVVQRICVHNGKFYGLRTDTSNGFYIYEYSGGNWVQKLLQADTHNNELIAGSSGCSAHVIIPYGGYLYVLLAHTGTPAPMVTCWKVDPVAWTATNVSSTFVPDGTGLSGVNWTQVNPKYGVALRFQEIPYVDSTGILRYIIVQAWTVGANAGWSAAVFHDVAVDGKWADVCVGGEQLWGAGGIIWDIDAGHTQIVGIVDHGTYIEIQHKCSHPNNKNIDVGIRYQTQDGNDDDGAPCTPYTGDLDHEGDTDLTTKPSTPVSLAALSDTFSGLYDDTKFMKCNAALDWAGGGHGWYGLGGRVSNPTTAVRTQYPIAQQSGGVYFGTTPMVTEGMTGAALALRWMLTGDFRIDLMLDRMNPGAQNLLASSDFALFAVVLEASNRGFGWIVNSSSGTTFLGTGLYFQEDGSCVIKADPGVHTLVDGNIMRISRTAGVMSIITDQGGASNDITPSTPPTLNDPMMLVFGAMSKGASTWAGLTLGPGFSDLLISDAAGGVGTGQVGKYKGNVIHKFMWDALADLGAVNKAVNFLSYFKQNNP
jgi:hypothetical protein